MAASQSRTRRACARMGHISLIFAIPMETNWSRLLVRLPDLIAHRKNRGEPSLRDGSSALVDAGDRRLPRVHQRFENPYAAPSGRVRRCRVLTHRVVDVTPTLDRCDVAVHRGEVGTHRHDRDVAPPSLAPRRNIASPLVVPAAVLLDRFE